MKEFASQWRRDAWGEGAEPTSTQKSAVQKLGIVSYTNVAPLHWGLEPSPTTRFVRGVPTDLNRQLLEGDIDLTLISSYEFLRHRHELRALPDFSIATLGPVYSVMLFHWKPWEKLDGARIALTTHSATSVQLLKLLLRDSGLNADFVPMAPDLDTMLHDCDAALLIGDGALAEAISRRSIGAKRPLVTDLGAAWYRQTRLPFTFAVWASRRDNPPSKHLVARLRAAREKGLGHLADVSKHEADRLGLSPAVVQRYLNNFRYYLEPPDRDGLVTFARKVIDDFVIDDSGDDLSFWNL